MPAAITANETLQLTISLPPNVAKNIRDQVQSGVYANESEYVESILLSESLFDPINQDELTHWMATEGVRRLEAMKTDPSQCLTHEEFWAAVEADEQDEEDGNSEAA